MISVGMAKKTTRYSRGGALMSHLPSVRCCTSIHQKTAGIETPADFDRIAGLEELRPAGSGIGQHRFDAAAVRQLDDIHGHVAEVEEIEHLAGEVIMVRIRLEARADRNLLGTQCQRAALSWLHRVASKGAYLAEPTDFQLHGFAAHREHLGIEDVAGADEVGDEAILREAVDPGWLVELFDAAVIHHRDAMRERE